MTATSSTATCLALALGGALLVFATYLATRPAAKARFGWAIIAGLAYAVLGLAAALHAENTGGVRAAVAMLVTVALSGALGVLTATRGSAAVTPTRLASIGRAIAWLSLVGLPPTIGFHAKIALCAALLASGWGGVTALALAGSALTILPALWEVRTSQAGAPRGAAAVAAVCLIVLIVLLGLYPYWGLGGPPVSPGLSPD